MPDAFTPKKILIAPLDWGLGHATRCIPVINEFLRQGCKVQIASSDLALILLKEEFPELKFHELVSYKAKYPVSMPFLIKMTMQLPKFLFVIWSEHRQVEEIVRDEKIDLVISDNRYGCWSQTVKSIFLGHQLNIKAPIFSTIINTLNQKMIRRFTECWVSDDNDDPLAGELAVNQKLKPKYIGLLSRMRWSATQPKYKVLAIISGPEPQRTIFENIILRELSSFGKECLMVRGLPGKGQEKPSGVVEIVNHLSSSKMNEAILASEMIIARPGYSTIMDLAVLGKQAIFVPTPNQTEQEYLAEELMKKKIAFTQKQDSFNLQDALLEAGGYSGFTRREENNKLIDEIKRILNEDN